LAPAETTCLRADAGASSCAGTVDSLSSLRRFVPDSKMFKWFTGRDENCDSVGMGGTETRGAAALELSEWRGILQIYQWQIVSAKRVRR